MFIALHQRILSSLLLSSRITPAIAVAVAAVKSGYPVRLNMERDVDMCVTGQRHPFRIEYKVGFTNEGRLTALDIQLWSNAGYSFDLSLAVLERAMLHVDNTYRFDHVRVRGRLCKTHLQSNTGLLSDNNGWIRHFVVFLIVAFRGFGGPQGLLGCETVIEHVATHLKMDPFAIRRLNMYKEGEITHFGQALERWHIPRLFDELVQSSDFVQRQKSVEEFNEKNTYRKRGITILPTKFGIAFTAKFLNQAGALVHVYKDGSVLISHGGRTTSSLTNRHRFFSVALSLFRNRNGSRASHQNDLNRCRGVGLQCRSRAYQRNINR